MSVNFERCPAARGVNWGIALYIPDATLGEISREGAFPWAVVRKRCIHDGWVAGWWERAHTARLGSMQSMLAAQRPTVILR